MSLTPPIIRYYADHQDLSFCQEDKLSIADVENHGIQRFDVNSNWKYYCDKMNADNEQYFL
jgi:hypothetical protein